MNQSIVNTPSLHWNVVSLFPEAILNQASYGVLGQAFQKGILDLKVFNPRDWSKDLHRTVDDRPFGGGDGMVMLAEVLNLCLDDIYVQYPETVFYYLSPQGPCLNETLVTQLSSIRNITLICGRYGGIDQRVFAHCAQSGYRIQEISIGDYVLSGGELAAGVVMDSVSRKIPGVLGHHESAQLDSFCGGLLEAPLFTRPAVWQGLEVPTILRGGHHAKILDWKNNISIFVTFFKRPDLFSHYLKENILNQSDWERLDQCWKTLTEEEKKSLGFEGLRWSSKQVQEQFLGSSK